MGTHDFTKVQEGKPWVIRSNWRNKTPSRRPKHRRIRRQSAKPHQTLPRHRSPLSICSLKRAARWLIALLALAGLGLYFKSSIVRAFNTVSTDDAYVNGHVEFVAPRIPGKVIGVFTDDTKRVNKGDLIVQIDPEPYDVQVNLKIAAVEVAEADLAFAKSQARGLEGLARSQRWKIQTASEQVNNQIALLKARVSALRTQVATLDRARSDYERGQQLVKTNNLSREDFDLRKQNLRGRGSLGGSGAR